MTTQKPKYSITLTIIMMVVFFSVTYITMVLLEYYTEGLLNYTKPLLSAAIATPIFYLFMRLIGKKRIKA